MKRAIAIAAGAILATAALAACGPNGNQLEKKQQQQDTQSLEQSQPLPHYDYSQERAALITAENIAANGTDTTSFFFNQGAADPVFSCPSIGLGVPDSASLSNPVQNDGNGVPIGQMDPDGIYAPTSSTGTFVNCVDSLGREYLVRWEGFVLTVTNGATWDESTHQLKLVGAPTVKIRTKK